MKEFVAIYRKRSDGDFDFVAAFAASEIPDGANWPQEIAEHLSETGEVSTIIAVSDLSDLTDVLTGQ